MLFRYAHLDALCADKLIVAQGLGGVLVRKVDGDYQNVVGFPAASFFKFLELLCDEEDDFLEV